jgi:hypothetical protein
MCKKLGRRSFLKKSVTASVAVSFVRSLEEHQLRQACAAEPNPGASDLTPLCQRWQGVIGKVRLSRLLCGGNLISGYAHSRDLIYVSELLKHYFTQEKILATWALCAQHGINTMVFNPSDQEALRALRKYQDQGGRLQFLAQLAPNPNEIKTEVSRAVDQGAVGAFLVGNYGDEWSRDGKLDLMQQFVAAVKDRKLIAGIGGHELRTVQAVEKAGIAPDFYVKTLHSTNYWSKRRPGQDQDVIENYGIDNYWCKDPEETIRYMSEVERPWIAYKVLAAGAIHPKAGFKHAFDNGADFALVGMFDFQIAEDVSIANELLARPLNRQRDWLA